MVQQTGLFGLTILEFLAAGGLLVGVVLLVLGLRGRRTDDHRLCRRCGYDLTGTPEAAICTECGRDLTAKKAVRLGHRQCRRGFIAGSLALLLPAVLVLSVSGYGRSADVDWQAKKPEWLLRRQLAWGVTLAAPAEAELIRRYLATGLEENTVDLLRSRLLSRQADATQKWDERTDGEFIVALRDRGQMSSEQWRGFLQNLVTIEVKVRPRVRHEDPSPLRIEPLRTGKGASSLSIVGGVGDCSVFINDEKLSAKLSPAFVGFTLYNPSQGYINYYVNGFEYTVSPKMPTGTVQLAINGRLRITRSRMRLNPPEQWRLADDQTTVDERFTISTSTLVEGAAAPARFVTTDERYKRAMNYSVGFGVEELDDEGMPQHVIVSTSPPLRLDHDLYARRAGDPIARWVDLNHAHWTRAGSTGTSSYSHTFLMNRRTRSSAAAQGLVQAKKVDFELRPNMERIMRATDSSLVWGGTIRIHDVPVGDVATKGSAVTGFMNELYTVDGLTPWLAWEQAAEAATAALAGVAPPVPDP